MNKLLQALAAVGNDEPRAPALPKASSARDQITFTSISGKDLGGDDACDLMRLNGEEVVVRNGAVGDHDRVFRALGFTEVISVGQDERRGRRSFLVREGESYFEAFQSIRPDRGGVGYAVDFEISYDGRAEFDRCRGR